MNTFQRRHTTPCTVDSLVYSTRTDRHMYARICMYSASNATRVYSKLHKDCSKQIPHQAPRSTFTPHPHHPPLPPRSWRWTHTRKTDRGRRTGRGVGGQRYRKAAWPHFAARVKRCQLRWHHSSTGPVRALPVTSPNKRITAITSPWLCARSWKWEHRLQLRSGELCNAFAAQMNSFTVYFLCHFSWWLLIITQMPSGNYVFFMHAAALVCRGRKCLRFYSTQSQCAFCFAEQQIRAFSFQQNFFGDITIE